MTVESERPHHRGSSSSSTSEFFICFTSRLSWFSSSSSMKNLSSKSILSPGHTDNKFRESTMASSLSSSLSRRLRSNGSMKGGYGQSSPMFPTGTKKRGAFETTEPSSPKVTCIGQVRVKTKKQGKKMRTRSKRRGGEMSFRKIENQNQTQQECLPHRNQRWVHLPLTICEALRAFGSEFNCFLPCRSSCTSAARDRDDQKGEKRTTTTKSSCGAAFARWLIALQEGEEEKGRREIELVVGEEVEERRERVEVVSEIETVTEEKGGEVKEEEEARVSICIPPRNALLLMRCRSEPLRMSALANRFWDSPVPKENDDDDEGEEEEEEEEDDEEDENEERNGNVESEDEPEVNPELKEEEMSERFVSAEAIEEEPETPQEEEIKALEEMPETEDKKEEEKEEQVNPETQEAREEEIMVEIMVDGSSPESIEEPENPDDEVKETNLQETVDKDKEEMEGKEVLGCSSSASSSSPASVQPEEEEREPVVEALAEEVESLQEKENEERPDEEKEEETETHENEEEEESSNEEESRRDESEVLPDCLLLMMCEPKLSMEVSKETWVCSKDFIRWRPEKKVITKDGGDEELNKRRLSMDSNPAHPAHRQQPPQQQLQPARSSCSNPAPPALAAAAAAAVPSMATMIEQKLGKAVGYEPFVLKRCKSEPMRTAAKLEQDACFWKNRNLEPHRPTTLGVGAAGIGF